MPSSVLSCEHLVRASHPSLEGAPDLAWRILLDIVNALHDHFALVGPAPAELTRAAGKQRPGLGGDEQFRYCARREPGPVVLDRRDNIRRLACNRQLTRPDKCREARL